MGRIYVNIFIFISLIILISPDMSFSSEQVSGKQVSGKQVHGAPPFSGLSFGHADIELDEEEFRKCIEKNKKKLEKAATQEVWEDLLKDYITTKIIAEASGGKISRYVIGTIVNKSVNGVVPNHWKHTAEAITAIMTRCANDSTKKNSLMDWIFGGKKKVSGQPVSGQPVSGKPVSGKKVSGQPVN